MSRLPTLAVATLSTALFAACGSSLSVEVVQPADLSLGRANTLALVDGYGTDEALDTIAGEVRALTQARNFYDFLDLGYTGASLDVGAGWVQLPEGAPSDAAFLRVDALEWYAHEDELVEVITDEDGYVLEERVTITLHATTVLAATLVTSDGDVLLDEVIYEGHAEQVLGSGYVDVDEMLALAAHAAIEELVDEMTPSRVKHRIPLDDDDESMRPIIELAQSGQLELALEEIDAWIAEHPGAPQGHYNKGAFFDAAFDYGAALDSYAESIRLGGPSWYANTRTDCEQRAEWAQTLGR